MKSCSVYLFLLILVTSTFGAFAQDNQTLPIDNLNKIVVYLEGKKPKVETIDGITYEIGLRKAGSEEFQLRTEGTNGTGFFVRDGNKLFLITAGHVARNLIFDVRLITADVSGNSVPFVLDKKIKWVFSEKADIAVTRINDRLLLSHFLDGALDINFLLKTETSPVPELPLVVIGFPLGLGVHHKFSPLRRETNAASSLIDLKRADINQVATFFILQDPSIGGYSGAPVFVIEAHRFGAKILKGFDANLCVGIIHGTISDKTGGKLGAVTPANYVHELMQ